MPVAPPPEIREAANRLTPAELAGQRLFVGFDGTAATGEIAEVIADFRVGGAVLFARNLEDPRQVRELTAGLMKCAADAFLPPLLLCVDQEGGRVARLKPPFTQFPGNPALNDEASARDYAATCAREMHEAGFHVNFAPVVDVVPESGESIMADRAFPGGPDEVAHLGRAVIRTLQENGVMAVAKHFPGIGRTVLDSHVDLPYCRVSRDEMEAWDLIPFRQAAHAGGMMLSHIVFTDLDPEWPASFSQVLARDLLRREMGYQGLVFTDDLDMGAVAGRFPLDTLMERLILCHTDVALICHPGPDIPHAHQTLTRLIQENPAHKTQAIESAARILQAKKNWVKDNG